MYLPLCFRRSAALASGFLLTITVATAQSAVSVTGAVRDAARQPLPFATAVLLHLPDSTVTNSQSTDEHGAYTFQAVPQGRYCVKALLMSYTTARSVAFAVAGTSVQAPDLQLVPKTNLLKGVVVRGQTPVLDQQADRLVLNVEKLNTAGDNALEVLTKAPGVRLDKDDNVLFRGSAGVTVQIDGKLTYMAGAALSSYLKSLPASAVSKIELITNPPASFDAAGTAGIINIRLRHNQAQGLNGTATASLGRGRYDRESGGVSLNYNVGKARLFTRLDAGRSNSFNHTVIVRHIRDSVFRQENYWHPIYRSLTYATGADVALTEHHTIGVQLRGSTSTQPAQVTSESVTTDRQGAEVGRLAMRSPQNSNDSNLGLNLNYRWQIDTAGQQLGFDADYVNFTDTRNQQFTNLAYTPLSDVARDAGQLRNDQSADVTIRALKADYVYPFAHGKARLETGLKTSWVRTTSAVRYDVLQQENWLLDTTRTNSFRYGETINAAYVSLNATLGKLETKAGLRAEQTHSTAYSPTTGQRIARHYAQLFPSLFLNYQLTDNDQLGATLSRRITRPNYQSLNPFVYYTDPYTSIQGNPFLAPSLSNSVQVNYTHKNFQVLSFSYLRENDAVNQVVYQDDRTKLTTSSPQNLGRTVTYSLSSGGHTALTKWWSVDNQLLGSHRRVQTRVSDVDIQLARFTWSVSSEHTVTLPRQYTLQLSGLYSSPEVYGLYLMRASGSLTIGLKKQLWHDKATLSLKVRDIFATDQWRSTLKYNNINTSWNNQYDSRRLSLTLQYKFGNARLKTARTRTATEEESRAGN